MGAIVSYSLHDSAHLKIVPVISSFDKEGNITPLYVRIEGEPLKIYNAYQVESPYQLLHFKCEVMVYDNCVRPLDLMYHVNEHTWSMPLHNKYQTCHLC